MYRIAFFIVVNFAGIEPLVIIKTACMQGQWIMPTSFVKCLMWPIHEIKNPRKTGYTLHKQCISYISLKSTRGYYQFQVFKLT